MTDFKVTFNADLNKNAPLTAFKVLAAPLLLFAESNHIFPLFTD